MDDLASHTLTLGPHPGARERWNRGRTAYAVWLARLDFVDLRRRYFAAQAVLDAWIRTLPAPDTHLTVWVAGFPCASPRFDDDVAESTLEAQAQIIARSPPLRLEVGGLRAFRSAAYLTVRDLDGGLARLRADLGQLGREQRWGPYVPHVTVGHFTADWPAGPILAAMAPLSELPPLPLCVTALERVDLDALREGAPLRPTLTLKLSGESR